MVVFFVNKNLCKKRRHSIKKRYTIGLNRFVERELFLFFFFLVWIVIRIGHKIKISSSLIILGRLLRFETPWSMFRAR